MPSKYNTSPGGPRPGQCEEDLGIFGTPVTSMPSMPDIEPSAPPPAPERITTPDHQEALDKMTHNTILPPESGGDHSIDEPGL